MSKRYIADKFEGGEFIGVNADTLTTAVSITNATLTDAGYSQQGKVVRIMNGANAINYTVNAGITASFVKGGTGAITFVQGAGRTLISNSGSFVWNGLVNGTVSIVSFGTTDILTFVSQSLYPAPFIDTVVPDSTLPSTTGNFELYGAFFKEDMVITFTGQTVNYSIFHSDNHVSVNVTTGATEGLFSITLNNGIERTFTNAYMVVLGDVFSPTATDWNTIVEPIDLTTEGNAAVKTFGSVGSAVLGFVGNITKKISFYTTLTKSPMGTSFPQEYQEYIKLTDSISLNSLVIKWTFAGDQMEGKYSLNGGADVTFGWSATQFPIKFRLYYDLTTFYLYGGANGTTLFYTVPAGTFTNNVNLKLTVKRFDHIGVKYVEHF